VGIETVEYAYVAGNGEDGSTRSPGGSTTCCTDRDRFLVPLFIWFECINWTALRQPLATDRAL